MKGGLDSLNDFVSLLQVMYLTATFPYIVTTVFLIRSAMLEGATDGLKYMLTPDVNNFTKILLLLCQTIPFLCFEKVDIECVPNISKHNIAYSGFLNLN